MLPAGDKHFSVEIIWRKRSNCPKHAFPSFFPPFRDVGTRRPGLDFELPVAVPVRFFSIGGEKIGPARTHIPRHVLNENRDAIGLWVNQTKNILIAGLYQSFFGELLIAAEIAQHIGQICRADLFSSHESPFKLIELSLIRCAMRSERSSRDDCSGWVCDWITASAWNASRNHASRDGGNHDGCNEREYTDQG